jgi:hypothetical protein
MVHDRAPTGESSAATAGLTDSDMKSDLLRLSASSAPIENSVDIEGPIQAFVHMRAIENVLRELIVASLAAVAGPRWHRTRMPVDVQVKFDSAVSHERGFTWKMLIPHHPIYYIDFPDLKKLIERRDNWSDVFQPIFGSGKDVVITMMSELEPLRNAIAHTRDLHQTAIDLIITSYERLRSKRFDDFLARTTRLPDIQSSLLKLRDEGENIYLQMAACRSQVCLAEWHAVNKQWWFDDDFLGVNLDPVRQFYALSEQYANLHRTLGDGYIIERWLAERQVGLAFSSFRTSFGSLRA